MMCLKDTDLIWKTFYLGSMSTISKLPFPLSPQISGLPAGPTCSEACWTPFSSNSWKSSTAFTPSAASVWDYGQYRRFARYLDETVMADRPQKAAGA